MTPTTNKFIKRLLKIECCFNICYAKNSDQFVAEKSNTQEKKFNQCKK